MWDSYDGDPFRYLIEKGAKVDHTQDWAPLYQASKLGRTEIVELLAKAGADVNLSKNATIKSKFTPLGIAAEKGHLEVVKVLVKAGADINLVFFLVFPI